MLTGLLMIAAPIIVYLVSWRRARRLQPTLGRIYRWLGGLVVIGGGGTSVYFAFHGGDQGGIAAYFLQIAVIAAYLALLLAVAAIQWMVFSRSTPDR